MPRYASEGARRYADPKSAKGIASSAACGFAHFLRACGLPGLSHRLSQSYCNPFVGETGAARSAYDGLMDSPSTTVTVPIVVNEQTVNHTVSIGELGKLVIPGQEANRAKIEGWIDDLVRDGLASRTPIRDDIIRALPNGLSGYQPDERYFDPARMVEMPTRFPSGDRNGSGDINAASGPTRYRDWSSNPSEMPSELPVLARFEPLWFTPRWFDRAANPDNRVIRLLQDTAGTLQEYLKDGNCNPAFHPAIIAANAPNPGPRIYSRNGGVALPYNWEKCVKGWRPNSAADDPSNSHFWTFDTNVTWYASLTARRPAFDSNAADWNHEYADAMFDVAQLVQCAYAILQASDTSQYSQGALVDLFATCGLYNVAQDRAYSQLVPPQPRGTSIALYRARLAQEADERKRRGSEDALRLVAPGFRSTGSDAADITAGAVGTLGLAITLAAALGAPGVFAACMIGLASLAMGLEQSPPPVDPTTLPLKYSDAGQPLWGLTPGNALAAWPCCRIDRQAARVA